MIASVEEFRKYNGVDCEDAELLASLLRAAEEVAANYLGYRPEYGLRRERLDGRGADYMMTGARPIRSVSAVAIDGAAIPLERIEFEDRKILLTGGIFPKGRRNVSLRYAAGYRFSARSGEVSGGSAAGTGEGALSGGAADGGAEAVDGGDAASLMGEPAFLIKNVVLRIASLMLTETSQNIGITSKSFGDSGTRTFINNTDYSKYLLPIAAYKSLVI
jgi:hypothetical protein